jgi:hypothetical protein
MRWFTMFSVERLDGEALLLGVAKAYIPHPSYSLITIL